MFGAPESTGSSTITMILYMVVIFIAFYFFLIRPQSKKKKQEDKMRNELKIGDEIITIGGIVGRIIGIKDESDSIIIETSIDRSKLTLKRWAIASCDISRENSSK